ncbi:MAG: RdgB/HAM1 family non-canonical purine NTP pyrophosphatase [Spirochaetales bacterium]|nr:RdgB/HAM1 family non-canonical purine NTP pyrophosphatase [Spirochaetales bacterium]
MKITLASRNRGKANEFRRLFPGHTIILSEEAGVDFSFKEDGSSFLENATGKARMLYSLLRQPVIADDSGLCVTALDGKPGVRSARFGFDTKGRLLTDREKNDYLLSLLESKDNRTAFFVCCMVLMLSPYRLFVSQETLNGEICRRQTGKNGFGYDPVFFLPERNKTVAELDDREKDELSHRGKAARHMLTVIDSMEKSL